LKAKTDCIPCILDDVNGAINLLTEDDELKRHIMRDCLEFLTDNIDLNQEPSVYITEVHRIIKRMCGIEVPFANIRYQCNELGLKLAERLKDKISELEGFEKFSMLARWSIAGNALDFRTVGTGYDFNMDEMERSLHTIAQKLDIDELPEIYSKIKTSKCVLFVHDNVGEIAFDKLLIENIQANGAPVTSAVRSGPITSDATMDDANQVNLKDAAYSVILAGPDTLGVSFKEMSQEFRSELSSTDLIIAKGQANYYVFSEHKDEVNCPIVCLFRTKCHIVSSVFGYKNNISIAAFI